MTTHHIPFFVNSYYRIKPLLPRRFQIAIRRWAAIRKCARYWNVWPIDARAALKPANWKSWPNSRDFALVLTHDVDTLRGRTRCDRIALMEESLGFRSSFNFVAESYGVPAPLRASLVERGFEVGIHGLTHNGNPFKSERIFGRQASGINRYLQQWNAVGFRSPCMYHRLDWIARLNIQYDASTFDTDPFEPQPDGVQTIFPFWVPGGSLGREYVELPCTLPQDFTLFILLGERGIDTWKRKLAWIAESGGMALINTHPDYMNFGETLPRVDEYPAKLYSEFLSYIASRYKGRFWHVLPKDMAQFWAEFSSSPCA